MKEAATTWALVVGIDRYDAPKIRELKGAVRDAIVAVRWLRKLGVPDPQILLHAAPCPEVQQELGALAVPFKAAREADLVASIGQLKQVKKATRLFVFLFGHGYYEPADGRLFLLQEAGLLADIWTNAGIEFYTKWLCSLPFRRQFLFVDGCQNYPYTTEVRPKMRAGGPGSLPVQVPVAANALVACFAAGQEQRALEVDGRGAFSRALFDLIDIDQLSALPPGDPRWGIIHHDWSTGARSVDLRRVIGDFVRDEVRDVTAAVHLEQRVDLQPAGAAQGENRHLMFRLPDVPTVRVRLSLAPPAAIPAVSSLRVSARDLFFDCEFRQGAAGVALPVDLRLPRGTEGEASCNLQVSSSWDETRLRQQFRTDADTTVGFQVQPRTVAAPMVRDALAGPTEREETFSVKTFRADGSHVSGMQENDGYTKVAEAFGTTVPLQGEDLGGGVTITLHEDGPEFRVPADKLHQGSVLVHSWAKAMRAALPSDVVVSTQLRGDATPGDETRLVFKMPAGGAAALAGALANHPAVLIQPVSAEDVGPAWRSYSAIPLSRLEASPVVDVAPGPQRVRLDLPWGGWTQLINAEPGTQAVVTLPLRVGIPPLRVLLWPELAGGVGRVVVLGETQPGLAIRSAAGKTPTPVATQHANPHPAWFATIAGAPPAVSAIVTADARSMEFPLLGNRSLAVQPGPGFRVEPLSNVPAPEWDLLVAKGELDELSANDAELLTFAKWQDELLGLAGAYALFARRSWQDLQVVTTNLRGLLHVVDVDLLAHAAVLGDSEPLTETAAADLRRRAGEIPVFRWGPRLARGLIERVPHPGDALMRWWSQLDRIERTLAPNSVWTAWSAEE